MPLHKYNPDDVEFYPDVKFTASISAEHVEQEFKTPMMEKDPNGIPAGQPGAKLDAGKSPLFQGAIDYFPLALLEVANVSVYGANKYSWKGWEKVPDGYNRYSNALGRHLAKEAIEGPYDLEIRNDPKFPAEVLHSSQVAWNALARLELLLREKSSTGSTSNTSKEVSVTNASAA